MEITQNGTIICDYRKSIQVKNIALYGYIPSNHILIKNTLFDKGLSLFEKKMPHNTIYRLIFQSHVDMDIQQYDSMSDMLINQSKQKIFEKFSEMMISTLHSHTINEELQINNFESFAPWPECPENLLIANPKTIYQYFEELYATKHIYNTVKSIHNPSNHIAINNKKNIVESVKIDVYHILNEIESQLNALKCDMHIPTTVIMYAPLLPIIMNEYIQRHSIKKTNESKIMGLNIITVDYMIDKFVKVY